MLIFAATSYGNDSCALIQFLHEAGHKNVIAVYNDTGWAADWWMQRVERMERWVETLGYRPLRTSSIGLEALVKEKKGWPRQGMQFCTQRLKIEPALALKDELDPFGLATCAVGVRREESEARKDVPEWVERDARDGGRTSWRPLYAHTEAMRDALLERAGIRPLPHRSRECYPCVNENREGLSTLPEDRIALVERVETELGFTAGGKPRVMFRPARKMGATGIREIVDWAKAEPRTYKKGAVNIDDEPAGDCGDAGFCGI